MENWLPMRHERILNIPWQMLQKSLYRHVQNQSVGRMLLFNLTVDTQVFEVRKRLCKCHTSCRDAFPTVTKDLLRDRIGMLGSFIEQSHNLCLALHMVLSNLSRALGQVGKWLTMSGQHNTCWQPGNLCQRLEVVAQGIGAVIFRIEANIGRNARQD